jgi:hypothetical protein
MISIRNHALHRLAAPALLVALALAAGPARGQSVDFIYVAPTATINTTFPGATAQVLAPGYSGVVVTAANQAAMLAAAPPTLRRTFNVLQPGQAFRARIDRVLRINGGRTDLLVLLSDDRTGLTGAGIFATSSIGGRTAVWPAASVAPAGGNRFRGVMRLGELAGAQFAGGGSGWTRWESVILHETLHTQFVGEKTRWGSISVVYGGDGGHYTSEIAGEQENPFEEGLGTFFGMSHDDPAGMNNLSAFLARDDARYLIESRSVLAGTSEIWNAPHREEAHALSELANPADRTGSYVWRYYRWRDVPGWYLLFSESTSMALHGYFWKHVNGNRDQALPMIEASASAMAFDRRKRFPTYAVNRLALQLEAFAATPDGRAARTAGRLTSSMYPFALLDLITHFGMTDAQYRQDYDRNHPDRQPLAYAAYFASHRARVRQIAQPFISGNPIRFDEAAAAIHQYMQTAPTLLTPP